MRWPSIYAPVRVNCVSPGMIDTPIRAAMPEAARREMLEKAAAALPVGRVGLGEDIARPILAFMANSFATGSVVYIDGGAFARSDARPVFLCRRRAEATVPAAIVPEP